MNQFVFFILGVLAGAGATFFFWRKGRAEAQDRKERDATPSGLAHLRRKKNKAKEKIIALVREKQKITNNDVENLLSVSDATATNYLEELEREEKIVQKGDTGRGVTYGQKNG